MSKFKQLGAQKTAAVEVDGLETFPAPPLLSTVTMTSTEVTAVCPVTSQPDYYVVGITYTPGKLCLESKSLKLYLNHFRNQGVFCEALAQEIMDDLRVVLKPAYIVVEVQQKSRGGISITATAASQQ